MTSEKRIKGRCVLCLVIILAVVTIGGMIFVNRKNTSIMAKISWPKICYDKSCFYVQIASTEYKRGQGLTNRRNLDENKGLLLGFQQAGIYEVGMRNVLMPLDIVRLDDDYTILYIKNNAQPCLADPCPVFASSVPAKYALEINAGLVEKMGLKEGKKLNFQK